MKRQNQDIVDNPESENNDPGPTEHMATVGDNVDMVIASFYDDMHSVG